ncbi:MAG: tRNA-dihydrouridine synthase family protein [Treponema sp.]|jgi:tRNA-dihydrouridine synthase|nr:tRNA-dihydrouridine synthase family protein [Treponema sp.]
MKISFLLAPMAELGHRALRELIEQYAPAGAGCDEYFTEMISAPGLLGGGPFEKWYLDAGPCPDRVVYQLAGADAERLAAAAALLDRYECAGIDINMGCAAPAITRTGAGVRWMEDLDRAGAMIGRVRKVTKKRLSVKLRLGPREDFDYLVRFCRRLEAEGVEFITLHPRTAGEKFRRKARWDYVGRLKRELGIPVAGNGDVTGAADLLRRAVSGECDAVMAGRAAVRAPWIFARARRMEAAGQGAGAAAGAGILAAETVTAAGTARVLAADRSAGDPEPGKPAPGEKIVVGLEETARRFLDLLSRYQPPEFHLSRARRFFRYYCDNFVWAEYLRNRINREETLEGIGTVICDYCNEHPEERETAM